MGAMIPQLLQMLQSQAGGGQPSPEAMMSGGPPQAMPPPEAPMPAERPPMPVPPRPPMPVPPRR